MNIAETKKQNNISEYIIYMYQTEDLIRAYEFDIEKIKEFVISHIPGEEVEKEELAAWYSEIIQNMQDEGIQKGGHLKAVQQYRDQLSDLKDQLLETDDAFKQVYEKAKPHIAQSISLSNGVITNEIQACLNGIYGLLLHRVNGKKIPSELMATIDAFGDVLSYLSYKFKQINFLKEN